MATLLNVPRPMADIIADFRAEVAQSEIKYAWMANASIRCYIDRIEAAAKSLAIESNAFAETVRSMRAAQREYFKTRTSGALCIAKTLERKVDGILAQLDGAKADKTDLQGELPL